jgi:putative ABC transport system permease protein
MIKDLRFAVRTLVRQPAFAGVIALALALGIGVTGAIALRRVVAGQLYGITALDPRVFATAAAVLVGVAALACFLPAQRAARVDPLELLRDA